MCVYNVRRKQTNKRNMEKVYIVGKKKEKRNDRNS